MRSPHRRDHRRKPQLAQRHRFLPGAERLEDRQLLAVTGVTEYSIPTPGGEPTVIVTGPDGNLWFTAGNSIGEINPTSHAVSEFLIPTPNAGSRGIVSGPDGNLWFTEESTGKVGSINPSTHVIAEYALPVPSSGPSAITAGSDGNLWFNEAYSFGGTLGFINPTTKAVTEVQVSGGTYLNSVTSGSDGNIWATSAANNDTVGNLIRVVPSTQAATVYHTAASKTDPTEITSGADGNLWFVDAQANAVGYVKVTTGAITEYSLNSYNIPVPTGITSGSDGNLWLAAGTSAATINPTTKAITVTPLNSSEMAQAITSGPDNNLWFADGSKNGVGTINPTSKVVAEYPTPIAHTADRVTAGADGNLWFSDTTSNAIGSINPTTGAIVEYTGPDSNYHPGAITTGADGNLWFVDGYNIWTFDPTTHAYARAATASLPFAGSITSGPGGNIWFADDANQYIGTVDIKTHALTEYHLATGNNPAVVALGPDGNLWFSDHESNSVGKFVPSSGTDFEYTVPTPQSYPDGMVTGADGDLWFLERSPNYPSANDVNIAEINPTTTAITEYALDSSLYPGALVAGSDGNIWFVGNGSIASISTSTKAISAATQLSTPGPVTSFVAGPDGNLWYNDDNAIGVARITQSGAAVRLSASSPTNVTVGEPFTVTVKALNGPGNVAVPYSGPVTLALADNPSGATLSGSLTGTAVNGVVTFTGLSLSKLGAGVTLVANGGSLIGSLTPAISVNSVVATQLVVTSQPPGSVGAGNPFGFSVTAEDSTGAVATTFNGTVAASILNNPGSASLGGTTSVTASSGVATFSGLAINQAGEGYTLQATSAGLTSVATSSITVSAQTTTTLTASPASPAYGQAVTLTAIVAPTVGSTVATGSVTFTDGSTMLGMGSLNGSGVATFTTTSPLAVGSHSLVASYAGDSINLLSQSSPLALSVGTEATTASLSVSPTSPAFGQAVTLTATVTAAFGVPTGMVTFTDGSTTLGTIMVNGSGVATLTTTSLAVGSHLLLATYSGDGNDQVSQSSTFTLVVGQEATTTTLTVAPSSPVVGFPITLTATVTAASGSPTGIVTFSDGFNSLGMATLNSSGVAVLTPSFQLTVGMHSLIAVYTGDTNDAMSQSAATSVTVVKRTTTATLAASPTSTAFGQSVTLTATIVATIGVPTGTFTFTDGSTTLGMATVNASGLATLTTTALGVGPHNLAAAYGGDANDLSATASPVTLVVAQDSTKVTVTAAPSPVGFGLSVKITATVVVVSPGAGLPGGTVTFKDGTSTLGMGTLALANGVETASFSTSTLSTGTHKVTAIYSGDVNDQTSTSAVVMIVVSLEATTTTLTVAPATTNAGQPLTLTATVVGAPANGLVPTGSVVFQEDNLTIGSGTLNGSGVASFATPGLTPGSHAFTAIYQGDAGDSMSQTAPVTRVIHAAAHDYDGDGKSDMVVFGYQAGLGYRFKIATSSSGFSTSKVVVFNNNGYGYGNAQSIPVPGDYFGDGREAYALWTPNAQGGMTLSAVSAVNSQSLSVNFGATTDVPVEADVDGDGKTDFGVFGYQPGLGYRFDFLLSSYHFAATQQSIFNNNGYGYGGATSIPVVADFDGSGRAGFGLYNPSTSGSTFAYVNPYSGASIARTVGTATDIPSAVDYDADGKSDLVLYGLDPASHGAYRYEVLTSKTNFNTSQVVFFNNYGYGYGNAQSIPVTADYEGNGKADFALFGPDGVGGSQFIYQTSQTGAGVAVDFATSNDIPLDAPSYLIARKVRGR